MKHSRQSQRGISLLLFLLVAIVFFSTIALSALNSANGRAAQERKTEQALQQAKDALIGYAATHPTHPGRLLCPERLSISSTIEGQAQGTCNSPATRIGRFPWNSLHLDRLTDGTGEPLWYALSIGFSAAIINSSTVGQLQLDGIPNAAVAIIFAPGTPLAGQARSPVSPTNPPLVADYLDLGNAGGPAFIRTGPEATFNDHIVVITQSDLFNAVNKRVLAELRGPDDQSPSPPAKGLRGYFNVNNPHQFPWADSNGDGSADLNVSAGKIPYNDLFTIPWLSANGWPALVNYTRISATSAQISIGSSTLKVVPCMALPCP